MQGLDKTGRLAEAAEALNELTDLNLQQTILQELVFYHWTATPPQDASQYLGLSKGFEEEHLQYLQGINDMILDRQPSCELSLHNYYFNEILNELLAQKGFAAAYKLLVSCGLTNEQDQLTFLIGEPENDGRFELAARLALQAMRKGHKNSEHYYALGRYFFTNQDYPSAQSMLLHALELSPEVTRYQELLQKVYLHHTLMMVQEALRQYPDNPEFNRQLIEIQIKLRKTTPLKGVH